MFTDKMTVEYVDHMGDDESVVNAARVSFAKEAGNYTNEQNHTLIRYLAEHKHELPFAHTCIQVRISAPIFVARQLGKSQVGFVWNEVSRRYVTDTPIFYKPSVYRGVAENKKQGSSGPLDAEKSQWITYQYEHVVHDAVQQYQDALALGLAPEQARIVLPQSMMTEWIWTGSLLAFARVYKLRAAEDTQAETREIAEQIGNICAKYFLVSWKALVE